MTSQYKITTEDTPYNGKPRRNDSMLDELLRTNLPYYKLAGVLMWLGAVLTTYLMIASLQPGTPLVVSIPIALGLQFVFTMAEKPIMHGRAGIFTYVVFALDSLINAGGLHLALANISQSPVAKMFASAGVSPDVEPLVAIALALVCGMIIAVAPETLWRQR